MFSGAFSRGSEPTQVTTMSGAIDGEDNVVSNATLAWLQSGRAGLRWKQPLQPQDDILKQLESDGDLVRSSASEKDRITSATRLGIACRSADPAVAAAATGILLTSLRSGKECEQRAAAYGLSVGGDAVISPLLDIVRDLLSEDLSWLQTTPHHEMTRDKGTGADYTWHIMVNAVFALGSFLHRVLHHWVACRTYSVDLHTWTCHQANLFRRLVLDSWTCCIKSFSRRFVVSKTICKGGKQTTWQRRRRVAPTVGFTSAPIRWTSL